MDKKHYKGYHIMDLYTTNRSGMERASEGHPSAGRRTVPFRYATDIAWSRVTIKSKVSVT